MSLSAARIQLDWQPIWTLDIALEQTCAWHQAWLDGSDMHSFTLEQIKNYWGLADR
mgnify:CR=1 FL=1